MKPQYTEAFSELPAGLLLTVTKAIPLICGGEAISEFSKHGLFFRRIFNDTSVLEPTLGSSTPRHASELC